MINKQRLIDEDELDRYEQAVQGFVDGRIDGERFQSVRLQQGIYGQRQDGVNMVRIKIPGGRLNPEQARTIADMVSQYSEHDSAHVTTRQSIQVHYVPLADTPAAIRQLGTSGLTTREACNNTVRNMTACPLAGVCPAEHTDVSIHLQRAASHFLRHPLTQHLPRKFKVSFSGCEQDCAQGMVHDLAVIAVRRNDRFGFKVLAGGGLGHKPHEAIVVEEFIDEQDLLACMEAVIAVHNRYSNRKLRAKSRIKFLLERFGAEGFIEKYRQERGRTDAALADLKPVAGMWHTDTTVVNGDPGAPRAVIKQKQAGLNTVPVHVPIGNVTAAQLQGIADIMTAAKLDDLRTTQDQNLMIVGVPDGQLAAVIAGLNTLGLNIPARGSNVVACPGTSTCRLGITSSTILGARLSGGEHDLRLRVSGCHNGCAQPETGDIGIYGEGNRHDGKLIPHYQVYIGGDGRGGRGLGFKSRSIPSARIEMAITDIQNAYQHQRKDNESFYTWSQRLGKAYFDQLLLAHATIAKGDVSTLLHDHGDESDFHVVQFGGGECAGAAQETVAALFAEASNERNYRNAFLLQHKHPESLECASQALRLTGNALLFLATHAPVDDLETLAQQIEASLSSEKELGQALSRFVRTLTELNDNFDLTRYTGLCTEIDQWTQQAAGLCQNINQQLDLSALIPEDNDMSSGNILIDLSSYGCPLHYIKARSALRQYQAGDVIRFLFASGDSARQASSSLESDGHQLLKIEENGITTQVTVRKAG
jgi:sulfite reductase beta subunit-like hemoprotein/TusA-related sulfurtransferase